VPPADSGAMPCERFAGPSVVTVQQAIYGAVMVIAQTNKPFAIQPTRPASASMSDETPLVQRRQVSPAYNRSPARRGPRPDDAPSDARSRRQPPSDRSHVASRLSSIARQSFVPISPALHDRAEPVGNDGAVTHRLEEITMRHLTASILLACAGAASGQSFPESAPDPDLLQAWPAWLVGDHAKARRHFLAAARRGNPLGQYNLAMMLVHGEGGPPSMAKACALLLTSAVSVELARLELKRCEAAMPVTNASPPGRSAPPAKDIPTHAVH
jgi:TPR repeat protein